MSSGSSFAMGRVPPEALLVASVALLLVLHAASSQMDFQFRKQQKDPLADFLYQTLATIREAAEVLLGPEVMHVLAEILPTASSVISDLCFALSRVSAQLLDAMGLEGERLTRSLKLSPDEVQTLLLWGVAALAAYWILALLGRSLKLILFLVAFVMMVRSLLELFGEEEEEPWETM